MRKLLLVLLVCLASAALAQERPRGSLEPLGGGGAGTGLQGSLGTEQTLAYLREQPGLKTNARALRRTLYFDAYLGDDTNGLGTNQFPYRSMGKAHTECRTYTRCVFRSNRVWSPTTWTLSNLGTAGDHFIVGETVSYNETGAGTARVVDVQTISGTTYMVTEDLTGVALTGSDAITGTTSGATGTTSAVINNMGAASDNAIVPDADTEFNDNVVILYEGEIPTTDRAFWPLINCNNTSFTADPTYGGFGLFYAGPGTGWIGVQRFRTDNCPMDFVTSVDGAGNNTHIIVMNTECKNRSGASDNCFTVHGDIDAALVVVNGAAYTLPDGTGGGSAIALNQGNSLIVNVDAQSDMTNLGVGSGAVYTVTGGDHTLIGSRLSVAGTPLVGPIVPMSLTNAQPQQEGITGPHTVVRLAHVSMRGAPGIVYWCMVTKFDGTTWNAALEAYFVSCQGGRGPYFEGANGANTITALLRGFMLDGITDAAGIYWWNQNAFWDSFSVEGVYDDSDAATLWYYDGVNSVLTRAAFDAAVPAAWEIFANNSADLAGGDAFGGSADLPCFDATKTACWEATDATYTVAVPSKMVGKVPVELIDGQTSITGFIVGGAKSNRGAW